MSAERQHKKRRTSTYYTANPLKSFKGGVAEG